MVKKIAVVLGGGIDKDGNLWQHTKDRVNKCVENYIAQTDSKIIVTGGCGYRENYVPTRPEADAMAEMLRASGVCDGDIQKETKSLNTFASAYYVKQILDKNGWNDIDLITSDYHMERAFYIFDEYFDGKYSINPCKAESTVPKGEYDRMVAEEVKKLDFAKKWMKWFVSGGDLTLGAVVKSHELLYYRKRMVNR